MCTKEPCVCRHQRKHSNKNANPLQSLPKIWKSCWSRRSFPLLRRFCQKKKNRWEKLLQPKAIASKTSTGTVKKQIQCLWCIATQTKNIISQTKAAYFPLNKYLRPGTFVETAMGFLSQSQLKYTCFETLWKSRNGFNNKWHFLLI